MASDGRSRIVIEVPAELKKSFKMYCTINDVPMTEVIEHLIRDYLSEQEWGDDEGAATRKNG